MTEQVYPSPTQSSNKNAPRLELAAKLIRYMTDSAAGRGECENAALKLVAVIKRDGINFASLAQHLAQELSIELAAEPGPQAQAPQDPPAASIYLGFGKYRHLTLGEIARTDIAYLQWLAEECTNLAMHLREAVLDCAGPLRIVLDHFTMGAA